MEVTYTEVTSQEDATARRFLGTPSVRVEGIDVEYGERPPEEVQTAHAPYYKLVVIRPLLALSPRTAPGSMVQVCSTRSTPLGTWLGWK